MRFDRNEGGDNDAFMSGCKDMTHSASSVAQPQLQLGARLSGAGIDTVQVREIQAAAGILRLPSEAKSGQMLDNL